MLPPVPAEPASGSLLPPKPCAPPLACPALPPLPAAACPALPFSLATHNGAFGEQTQPSRPRAVQSESLVHCFESFFSRSEQLEADSRPNEVNQAAATPRRRALKSSWRECMRTERAAYAEPATSQSRDSRHLHAVDLIILVEPTFSLNLVGQRAPSRALCAWRGGLVVASREQAFFE